MKGATTTPWALGLAAAALMVLGLLAVRAYRLREPGPPAGAVYQAAVSASSDRRMD